MYLSAEGILGFVLVAALRTPTHIGGTLLECARDRSARELARAHPVLAQKEGAKRDLCARPTVHQPTARSLPRSLGDAQRILGGPQREHRARISEARPRRRQRPRSSLLCTERGLLCRQRLLVCVAQGRDLATRALHVVAPQVFEPTQTTRTHRVARRVTVAIGRP